MNRTRSLEANPGYSSQVLWLGVENLREGPELAEKSPSRGGRDTVGGSEGAFGGSPVGIALRALRVTRTIDSSDEPTPAECDPGDPGGRVRRMASMNHPDTQLVDRDQEAANRVSFQRALEQRLSLNEEVAPWCSTAKSSNLPPEASLYQRAVKVADRLPLDDGQFVDRVVARSEARDPHVESQVAKRVGNPASTFVNIGEDVHRTTMPREVSQRCDVRAPTWQLAISPGS